MNITEKQASDIMNVIREELIKRGKKAIIAVSDSHGELVTFLRMDSTKLPSVTIAMNKAYTAARTQKKTSEIGKAVNGPDKMYELSFYGDSRLTGFGGGVPVLVNNVVVGGVGVSGLSQEEDEELASMGAQLIR